MHTDVSHGTSQRDDGPSERRSAEQRREQLLDAAVAVIAEHGLERATTRAITDRAGLALGAFHYVFDSKDELLEAVAERVAREIDASVTETASPGPAEDEGGPTGGPGEGEGGHAGGSAEASGGFAGANNLGGEEPIVAQLRALLLQAWRSAERSRSLHLAQYELTLHALRDPEKHHLAVQQYALMVGRVAALVRGQASRMDDEASRDLARFVVATLDGLLLQWLVEQDDDAAEGRLRRYLDVLPAVVATHGSR